MTPFTETVTAWLPSHADITPEQLINPVAGTANRLGYTRTDSTLDMGEHGWTKIGTAEITLHIIDRDTLVTNKIDALKAEAAKTRAEAVMRCNEIESQIQNLLAITYVPKADHVLRD